MHGNRILIVEPDVLVRHPFAQYLRDHDWIVLEARNAGETRTLLYGSTIPIDIVIIDADAPAEEGSALANWIRRNFLVTDVISAKISAGSHQYPHVLQAIQRQHAAGD